MDGSFLFIQSTTLCHFMGAFKPFTLTLNTERENFNDAMLPVKSLFVLVVTFYSVSLLGPFYVYRTPLNISCRAGFVVTKLVNDWRFWNVFISPSILNDSLAGLRILGCMFFLDRDFKIPCQPFLSFQVCVDRCVIFLIFLPLYVRNFFALEAFNTVSLHLIFANCTMT